MIQKQKGTYDVYGCLGKNILYIQTLLEALMEKYNYEYMKTPIIEASELYHRGVGETSDIVSKETYDFIDRGDRRVTLRPEGTAGIVRSFIENKMYADPSIPKKVWYFGPMYRYERPQAGRYREFYQFGVEAFGSSDPALDAEVISIPVNLYQLLGLKGIKVNINSLGDLESRQNYREALIQYFEPHKKDLCEDCQRRLEKNPLRVLDCKVDSSLDIMKNAPCILDYLNEESKKHFEEVQKYLEALKISYTVNPKIVRGLDYYTHTVFEVEADIQGFGSQNVLCGGGRYDTLVEKIGGPSTPGVGFALGLERLLEALEQENITLPHKHGIDLYVIPLKEAEKAYAFSLVNALRMSGFTVDMDFQNRNMKANFKQSERLEAKYNLILGEEEVKTDVLTLKSNETKEEFKISKEALIDFLDENIEE